MLRRCTVVSVVTVLLLAALSLVRAGPASANDTCDLVQRPADSITVDDPTASTYVLDFAIDGSGPEAVERVRVIAGVALANHAEATRQAVNAYLDSILAWYRYLADPCATAVSYPGPFTTRPEIPGSPFGFGGVDVAAPPSFAIIVNGVDGEVAAPSAPVADGPALAHSGSESFVLAYFGAGLLAFGASALGMRRWMSGPWDEHKA